MDTIDATPLLVRQLAWNTLPCYIAPVVLTEMGMTPPSEEGLDVEHAEGHSRKNALIPLVPAVAPMVKITADLLARYTLEDTSENSYSEDEREAVLEHYQGIIMQSSIGILSQLLHMGVLNVTAGGAGEFLG